MKWIRSFLFYIFGGLFGALINVGIQNCLMRHISEYYEPTSSAIPLILLGITTSICLFPSGIRKWQFTYSIAITYALVAFMIIGILLGKMDNDIVGWLILIPIMTSFIYVGKCTIGSLAKTETAKQLLSTLGAGIGGFVAGGFFTLISHISTSFSIDVGYAILVALILAIEGAIFGIAIIGTINFTEMFFHDKHRSSYRLITFPRKKVITSLLFVLVFLLASGIWVFYHDSNYLMEPSLVDSNKFILGHNKLPATKVQDAADNIHFTRESLVELLENQPNKDITVLATLYLLSGKEAWAQNFRNTLFSEAQRGDLTDASGSVKAKQFGMTLRAYYYLEILERNPSLFPKAEKQVIFDWFKDINERVFSIEWSDFYYGIAYQRIPDGPYENQEIGVGALAVLSTLLAEEYPELARKDNLYVDKFAQGWKGNFRNPDDGIVYHQTLWIKNAYILAKYGGQAEYIRCDNSRNSFEWILTQWASSGISPAYNTQDVHTAYDVMALGAYLFNDGRYKWLAEKMLVEEVKAGRDLFGILGLSYWCDNLEPQAPRIGSSILQGTTGYAQKPSSLKPDKVVFRDGWKQDSLYALLNLRYAGWHSYKATNSIINITYGVPFVVENIPIKEHSWLPQGIAKYRDKKIDRIRLNCFQIELGGIPKTLYQVTGFGSSWSQDPPYFADISFFDSTDQADFSRTIITNWHGWTHSRDVILVKGNYLVVFDRAQGSRRQRTGISWHLKGAAEFDSSSVILSQDNYSLTVHYPHLNNWYQVTKLESSKLYPPAGEIHDSDINLYMMSENQSEVGFITLFHPNKKGQQHLVDNIDVHDRSGTTAYPHAIGVKIINLNSVDIVGTSSGSAELWYDTVSTDAEVFVFQDMDSSYVLSFKNANNFMVRTDRKPSQIEYNGRVFWEGSEWYYSVDKRNLILRVPNGSGEIKVLF